ncbi:helix-turn-helix transcriptional regulator [Streptomyces sp. NPDC013178]|uniref:helix-turn-helix transcriptional regulator n=1 Tax=Streptomyces sp. NPDC013178 TaxID=3155118 RepID=UPI0033C845F0
MADRAGLAAFLRARREALQPEDVALPRGRRRRVSGLRREEVAALCGVSLDYYSRLEQPRGPHPSEQILAAVARGLHLSAEERDHLFLLAGYAEPRRLRQDDHVNPGMMRILDRLKDTPALVVNRLGETLMQTRPAVALLGDQTAYTGWARSAHYRWFADPASRELVAGDHAEQSWLLVADLYGVHTRAADDPRVAALVDALYTTGPEFAALWRERPVLGPYCPPTRLAHPQLGELELHCQTLVDPDLSQRLMVYTAVPGSESNTSLKLLPLLA